MIDFPFYAQLKMAEDILFVIITAVILYLFFHWGKNSLLKSKITIQESYRKLQLAHTELETTYIALETTHLDLEDTHEKLVAIEEELQIQFEEVQNHEAYYRRVYEGMSSGILIQDCFGKLIHANDAACRLLKYKLLQFDEIVPLDSTWTAKYLDGTPFIISELTYTLLTEKTTKLPLIKVIEVSNENGRSSWISLTTEIIGDITTRTNFESVTTLVDITEQRVMEAYEQLLKEIDQQVLQEKPLIEIQQLLCDRLVNNLDFPWVWIGKKADDGTVVLQVQQGIMQDDQLLVRWDESPLGQGVTGRAIRAGKYKVDYGVRGGIFSADWEEICSKHGFHSLAAFPLVYRGETFGVLNFCSKEYDFFSDKLIAYLEHFSVQLALAFNSANDREHLERYRLLAEDSIEVILFVSSDGKIVDTNNATEKCYGYTREELLQMPIDQLFFDISQIGLDGLLSEHSINTNIESLHLRKNGSIFPTEICSKGATYNGNPITLFIISDITERKNAETAVWLEKERAQVTLDSIGDAVITTDVLGNVEYLNPIAEALTGWTNDEAVGISSTSVFRIFSEDTGEIVESPITQCLREGQIVGSETNTVLIHGDGHTISVTISAAPIRNRDDKVIGGVLVFHDVSEKQNHMKEMIHQAHHDALTGLPNRLLFNEHLSLALGQAKRRKSQLAVIFLDLDRFKLINDTMGHNVGDLLLKAGAERLKNALREGDTIARLGGDEFLVLLPEIAEAKEAATVTKRLLEAIIKPFVLDGNEVFISTSIGISLFPNDGDEIESLVKQADIAMYHAKELGRNNFQFFTHELNVKAQDRLSLENNLRKAIEREEFVLHYQPQVDLETDQVVGLEALIRWNSADRGIVPPASFIPIAEETGLIVPIGEWVLRRACEQNVKWQRMGYPLLKMSVNISARQFLQPNLVEIVESILKETELDPQWLELEITESIAMEKGEATVELLNGLKELGVLVSIDDFGTGFSSLGYLRRLPIDTLKIDQTFVRDISSDEKGEAVITAIISLARNLRLKVIAEGVETQTQWAFLKAKRCDVMQGYFFSKPLCAEAIEKRILDNAYGKEA